MRTGGGPGRRLFLPCWGDLWSQCRCGLGPVSWDRFLRLGSLDWCGDGEDGAGSASAGGGWAERRRLAFGQHTWEAPSLGSGGLVWTASSACP